MRRSAALLLVLLLSACQYVTTAVDRTKAAADAAAKVEVQLPCAMTVGAFYRVMSNRQRMGVMLLCDPDAEKPTQKEIDDAKGN